MTFRHLRSVFETYSIDFEAYGVISRPMVYISRPAYGRPNGPKPQNQTVGLEMIPYVSKSTPHVSKSTPHVSKSTPHVSNMQKFFRRNIKIELLHLKHYHCMGYLHIPNVLRHNLVCIAPKFCLNNLFLDCP